MTTAERRAKRATNHPIPKAIKGPSEPDTIDLDEDVASFVLRQVAGGRKRVQAVDRIVSGEITRTMEGASTLTIVLQDNDRQVLRSGVFGADVPAAKGPFRSLTTERKTYDRLAAVDVQVDGVWFRLAQASVSDDQLTLTFEDREVSYLREHARNERVSRSKMTRAEFVHTLVRKVKVGGGIKFESPDEHVRQAIAAAQETASQKKARVTKPTSRAARDAKKVPGFNASDPITVKGTTANSRQLSILENTLDVGRQLGASPKVMQAAIVTVTQESDAGESMGTSSSIVGPFQQDSSYGDLLQRNDIKHAAYGFFQKAIASNKANPALSIAALAESVQKSNQPQEYAKWTNEAAHTVSLYLGGDLAGLSTASTASASGAASTRTYAKSYQFTVGQPGKPETYWDAIQRLASEVEWRAFMDRGTLWFVSDETLMRQRPRVTISEPAPGASSRATRGVESIDFDWDTGKPVLEATVTAWTGRWQAPPGCVINITGSGQADGRWLVWTVNRSLFDALATITLKRPHRAQREPAHDTGTVTQTDPKLAGTPVSLAGSKLASYPLSVKGKLIGVPYQGTHGKAFNVAGGSDNWESENAYDIGVPTGTPVLAVADGTIGPEFGSLGQGGRFAGLRLHLITANNEYYYAHLSRFAKGIAPGVRVAAGTVLGYSGEANGVQHLHFAAQNGDPLGI